MARELTVQIECRRKWWFPIAFHVGWFLLWSGLIGDAESNEHWDGHISATERVTSWLVTHALIIDVR